MTPLESSIEPPGRAPFSSTVGKAPSSRARAAAHNPAIPAPAISNSGQGEGRLVLDVLDLDPLRAPDEHGVRVCRVDDVVDLDPELAGLRDVILGRLDQNGEMVQQRPLRIARLTLVELDERPADLHPWRARGPRRSSGEAQPEVLLGRLLGRLRPQRDVVEVVLDLRRRLDEPEPQPFRDVCVDLTVAWPVQLGAVERAERRAEARDPQRDVLERALLA